MEHSPFFCKGVLLIFWLHHCVFLSSSETIPSPSDSLENAQRDKRNIAQLGFLVNDFTPFHPSDLISHGFWCGVGGNRKRDGSIYDECDDCCRMHDFCYDNLMHGMHRGTSRQGNVLSTFDFTDFLSIGLSHFYPFGEFQYNRRKKPVTQRPSIKRSSEDEDHQHYSFPGQSKEECHPYLVTYVIQEGADKSVQCVDAENTCSRKICNCDVEFVGCLRRTHYCSLGDKKKEGGKSK